MFKTMDSEDKLPRMKSRKWYFQQFIYPFWPQLSSLQNASGCNGRKGERGMGLRDIKEVKYVMLGGIILKWHEDFNYVPSLKFTNCYHYCLCSLLELA